MIAAKEDCSKMASDAKLLKDVTTKLLNLRLDHTEFTCLKALALFKPGTMKILIELKYVRVLSTGDKTLKGRRYH